MTTASARPYSSAILPSPFSFEKSVIAPIATNVSMNSIVRIGPATTAVPNPEPVEQHHGLNVLRLSGTPYAMGLQHGQARKADIRAIVAQSQKRSAVYDIITNPGMVSVNVA